MFIINVAHVTVYIIDEFLDFKLVLAISYKSYLTVSFRCSCNLAMHI